MKLLAFDTSTELLTVAVRDGARTWSHEGAGGAQASSTLLPAALRLLAEAGVRPAQLDAIAFGRGPGSFTGLRTACAVAQGLARAAGLPVLPVDTLMAVAEEARGRTGARCVTAVLDARMGEVYAAHYRLAPDGWSQDGPVLLAAPSSLPWRPGWLLAGNALEDFGAASATQARCQALPRAQALLRLAPGLLARGLAVAAEEAAPVYVRDKVARTTAERAADRAAACA